MTLIDEFKDAIDVEIEHETVSLAQGGAASYDDYRYRAGMIKGLMKTKRILDDVVEEVMKRDEKF